MSKTVCVGLLLSGLILGGCVSRSVCPKNVEAEGIIAAGAKLREISTEFKFTEGPASDWEGNIYFTDQPNDRIMVYTTDGELKTCMQPAGRANGLYHSGFGLFYACADEHNELSTFIADDKQPTLWASLKTYKGKPFNGPNDVWIHPNGAIYFTDPYYKRPWWDHDSPPQNVQGVYYLTPKRNINPVIYNPEIELNEILSPLLVLVADDLKKPNGIIGTPDGKILYVADIGAGKTYAYDIQPDGTLSGKRLFCEMGSDGMTIDCCGNVYLTGKGVTVFNAAGEKIEQIDVPQRWTANVTFGGKNRDMLFITASTGVYTMQMNVRGVR